MSCNWIEAQLALAMKEKIAERNLLRSRRAWLIHMEFIFCIFLQLSLSSEAQELFFSKDNKQEKEK